MRSPIEKPQIALVFAAIGAVCFWSPDLVVYAIYSRTFDTPQMIAITFLMPATLLCAYLVARRFAERFDFKRTGVAMLVGVWLTGGMFMLLAATPSGSGFASGGGIWVPIIVTGLSLTPIYTLMAATYEGSLFALIAVTLVPFLLWCVRSSGVLHPLVDNSCITAIHEVVLSREKTRSNGALARARTGVFPFCSRGRSMLRGRCAGDGAEPS